MGEVTGLLTKLAEKLGTTVDQLAPHYVEYIWADGLTGIITSGILAVLIAAGIFVGLTLLKKPSKEGFKGNEEPYYISGTISLIVTAFLAIPFFFNLVDSLPRLISPEGYAVSQLIKKLS